MVLGGGCLFMKMLECIVGCICEEALFIWVLEISRSSVDAQISVSLRVPEAELVKAHACALDK